MSADAYMQEIESRNRAALKQQEVQGYLLLGLALCGFAYMGLQRIGTVAYLPEPDVKLVFAFFLSITWIVTVASKWLAPAEEAASASDLPADADAKKKD